MILLDTNVFYNFLFETELTDKATRILETDEEFCTTFTVLNEVVYIISRKLAERKYGIRSYYDFRSLIVSEGYNFCSQEVKSLMKLIEDLKINVLNDCQDVDEVCTNHENTQTPSKRCLDSCNMQALRYQEDSNLRRRF